METVELRESVDFLIERVDRDRKTVPQVIIKAGKSKNNRNYPETVLLQAVSLFENAQTYRDHPSKADLKNRPERSMGELTGWLSNVRYDESRKALIGTRHFANTQAGRDAWGLVEQIVSGEAPPTLFGASINALGKGTTLDDGMIEVDAITSVISVDDVTSPAAGGGFDRLIASDGGLVAAVFEHMDYMEWFEARPDYRKRLQKEMKVPRQDDAVKDALAEADRVNDELKQLQATHDALKAGHEAVTSQLEAIRRELAIEKALRGVNLPQLWETSLRKRLLDAPQDAWVSIIQEEKQKAGSSSQRTKVSGASRQVDAVLNLPEVANRSIDWAQIDSPEKQKALLENLNRKG